jgi:hypothetical protein
MGGENSFEMTDIELGELILEEFKNKHLGVTNSYLEIHEPIYENGKLRIDRIDREKKDQIVVAYVPVKDEYFFFAIYIDTKISEIFTISTESRNLVSLIFTSETMTSGELQSLTMLSCQECWNTGDKEPNKKTIFHSSGIEFEPNPEPDEIEDKLEKLLAFIESDKEGIIALSNKAKGFIHVLMDFHYGNHLLGGLCLKSEVIKRIGALNISVDFQITAWGKSFK